jgi:hypothetical protein
VGERSRGRFVTRAGFPVQDCSPYRGLHVRRERLDLFKEHSLSLVRNPSVTIRNLCIAVSPLASRDAMRLPHVRTRGPAALREPSR